MLRRLIAFTVSGVAVALLGCTATSDPAPLQAPCSPAWFDRVESQVPTGDGQGHGPDVGSMEWRSVVEFKLGIRGSEQVPSAESIQWCHKIDELVFGKSH